MICPVPEGVARRALGKMTYPGQLDNLVAPLDLGQSRPLDYLAYKFDIVLRGPAATPMED